MRHKKSILIFGFFSTLIVISLPLNIAEAAVFYGTVVGTEAKVIQVKGKDGKVSVFWLGHKTRLDSRLPFFGDRVRIEYAKDKLGRNAATRVTILEKK